jgi:hypothetical protein
MPIAAALRYAKRTEGATIMMAYGSSVDLAIFAVPAQPTAGFGSHTGNSIAGGSYLVAKPSRKKDI